MPSLYADNAIYTRTQTITERAIGLDPRCDSEIYIIMKHAQMQSNLFKLQPLNNFET